MEPFIGQIQAFGFNFPPRSWAECNGQLLPISQNSALFSLLGTIYGGDGRTTFALPDLRGRSIVHQGSGPGLPPASIGQRSGSTSFTLNTTQIPAHSHTGTINASSAAGEESAPNGNYIAQNSNAFNEDPSSGTSVQGVQTNNTGGGQAVNHRSPYLVVNVCIALQGIFPPRN